MEGLGLSGLGQTHSHSPWVEDLIVRLCHSQCLAVPPTTTRHLPSPASLSASFSKPASLLCSWRTGAGCFAIGKGRSNTWILMGCLGQKTSLKPFRTGHSKALTLLGLQPFPRELRKSHTVVVNNQAGSYRLIWRALAGSPREAWKFRSEGGTFGRGAHCGSKQCFPWGILPGCTPPRDERSSWDSHEPCIIAQRKYSILQLHCCLQHAL